MKQPGSSGRAARLALAAVLSIGTTPAIGSAQAPPPPQASPPTMPGRVAEMQHHFVDISRLHEALVGGDLPAAREPARRLMSVLPPDGLSFPAAPFVAAIRQAGKRALDASSLSVAASATATMLVQCGECHRAAGLRPAPAVPTRPDVGGIVGHMLEHERALDDLLRGLITPSDSSWSQGAERLRTAPLRRSDLPPDPQLTAEVRRAEAVVHQAAGRAADAGTPAERVSVYARLLTGCAQCHGLHRGVWGPRTPVGRTVPAR